MTIKRSISSIGAALVLAGALAGAWALAPSMAHSATTPKPIVYQHKLACCQSIALGSQANPTLVAQSGPLPTGTYLVHVSVGLSIGANDSVICATTPNSHGFTSNDSIFGAAGNGSASSVAGQVTIVDTWRITTANDKLDVTCNVTNPGHGTTASEAVIELEKVGTLVNG